jgi:hypothetical protein
MPISESQLDTWSHQGAITSSAITYDTIQKVLNSSDSPYYAKSFSTFLQGSYGNSTNIFADSDVDIVMRLDDASYNDTDALTPAAKVTFDRNFVAATYGYNEFKADVLQWLKKKFGAAVTEGTKAIYVKGDGARREADVLVCLNLRRYRSDSNGNDDKYTEGIRFFKTDGTQIDNFPKQHAENCTEKHKASSSWFKPTVRVYKNVRNSMIEGNHLEEGVAPSYYIEGMLWNVPVSFYGSSYQSTFVATLKWLKETDKTKLVCANEMYYLVRDNTPVCWSNANFDKYISALTTYWNNWDK